MKKIILVSMIVMSSMAFGIGSGSGQGGGNINQYIISTMVDNYGTVQNAKELHAKGEIINKHHIVLLNIIK